MRVNNLEFRKTTAIGQNEYYYEIVEWVKDDNLPKKEYCYTILRWIWSSEQPDIEVIGSRPFEVEDTETLWKLMKYGQDVIQAEYDLKDIM
jgi:hypothetical protein